MQESWIHPSPVRRLRGEPRRVESHLQRLRVRRLLPTCRDILARDLDRWIRAALAPRQCRSLLLSHRLAERLDDRRLPGALGPDQYTPDRGRPLQPWWLVWLLRGPDLARRRAPPLPHVASAVARSATVDRQRAHCARRTNFVWSNLHLLRRVALRLRHLHSQHGARLVTHSPGARLPHRASPRCSGELASLSGFSAAWRPPSKLS